jgi:ATP-dependent DNA helicase RecQ
VRFINLAANLHHILKEYWGYPVFRPLQEEVMRSVLSGQDTLALMPTGGGKSLCYQVPAMAMDGLCLVISPLIALMKDQVEGLRRKNITAYSIFSGMGRKEVRQVFETVIASNCKFLYVSPERLETALFKEYLPGLRISMIAVDEAHCISQWGYDFRPPYLRIANLREELPGVPVLALTASATPTVQGDICHRLTVPTKANPNDPFTGWNVFRQSFDRPNLSYSAFRVESRINKIIEVFQKVSGTGIVYCRSRKRTKEISELLSMHGVPADYYHAGLTQEERNSKQEAWIKDRIRVIVCTNAFGMGIDKPNVRAVVHADVPDCLENYYQEAGRAGRDGHRSYAVLLYDEDELAELLKAPEIRFPSLEDIRSVYQAIANYLQLAAGTGEGVYFDFAIDDFLRKFPLNSQTVVYSLKALEQDGWLSFNEQVFMPGTVHFNITKDRLYAFERERPAFEPLIKCLLRAYEGIFDYPANVSELQIAGLLKKTPDEIKVALKQLDQQGVIGYSPRKDSPQLYFLRNRAVAKDLNIDLSAYAARRKQFEERISKMVDYVREGSECRSRITASYFGDDNVKPCGICDNCLRKKKSPISREEFEMIQSRITGLMKNERWPIAELMKQLNDVKNEKAWKVIESLQAENKIEIDGDSYVMLKK